MQFTAFFLSTFQIRILVVCCLALYVVNRWCPKPDMPPRRRGRYAVAWHAPPKKCSRTSQRRGPTVRPLQPFNGHADHLPWRLSSLLHAIPDVTASHIPCLCAPTRSVQLHSPSFMITKNILAFNCRATQTHQHTGRNALNRTSHLPATSYSVGTFSQCRTLNQA